MEDGRQVVEKRRRYENHYEGGGCGKSPFPAGAKNRQKEPSLAAFQDNGVIRTRLDTKRIRQSSKSEAEMRARR